jgi:S-adenosylmethionine:tRNA ribosyltransferase-isomerase
MRVADFDFDLPEDLIALRPVTPREAARLLVVRPGEGLEDLTVGDLPSLLRAGDALVFNDTRVIPARLDGRREARAEGGGDGHAVAVEATLHKRLSANRWSAFMRPGKRLKVGDRVRFGATGDRACEGAALDAILVAKGDGGEVELAFDLSGPDLDIAINTRGHMPLPPYIAAKRPEDEQDRADYQTLSTPARTARWRRRQPACISRRTCWRGWRRRGCRSTSSPCTSGPAPSCP